MKEMMEKQTKHSHENSFKSIFSNVAIKIVKF